MERGQSSKMELTKPSFIEVGGRSCFCQPLWAGPSTPGPPHSRSWACWLPSCLFLLPRCPLQEDSLGSISRRPEGWVSSASRTHCWHCPLVRAAGWCLAWLHKPLTNAGALDPGSHRCCSSVHHTARSPLQSARWRPDLKPFKSLQRLLLSSGPYQQPLI